MRRESSVASWIGAVLVVLGVVVAGVYLARTARQAEAPSTIAPASSSSMVSSASPASIQHPITQADAGPAAASTAALPALDDSDASVAAALAALAKGSELPSLLVRQQIIARIVATIDALPRRGLASFMSPLHAPKGNFVVDEAEGTIVIGAQNSARYAPYMRVVDVADPQALVAWYAHAYPLFQQAYQQLGYPKGYFNDRLIVVIDNLLAAPEPGRSPAVILSKGFYVYADPALESLSAGQKLLLRAGPASEAKIKAKLRAIRSALIGQTLPPAPAAASSSG
ncbi:DUF3014 domain-containing protein [Rhodanobacter glycinis]|uniref:DUF3014 domain-containing protein n=1 Tax=Rhodanobacter glycinis TaxID=582702 RepID=A0A502C929_9GAMM|nr:DUF3014 domain-containing protein [Rhodanobacter glycinis]TPG08236.1 DUF3014 domain-containing protein [Rhodanobacter glycinis]TPG50114.1 DUF3014 domain-containing protein [Rhodanobacter glycinis]